MITSGIGPIVITGRVSVSPGSRIGKQSNGSVTYDYKTTKTFTDVTVNGVSMKPYKVFEVSINANGYGYVTTLIDPSTGSSTWLPDGSWITYVNFGKITIA